LLKFNVDEQLLAFRKISAARAFQSVIRLLRTERPSRPTNLHGDGGFDENDVVVALSLPVVVLHAHADCAFASRRELSQDPAPAPRLSTAMRHFAFGTGYCQIVIKACRTEACSGHTDI
jgi:hypothetical protein